MPPFEGTSGNDTIGGTQSADTIDGFGGNDLLRGYGGNDTLNGGSGNDDLEGGEGDDMLRGGIDDDTLTSADGGSDQLYGEGGNDRLIMSVRGTAAIIIDGGDGNDVIQVSADQATIIGGSGTDTVYYSGGSFQGLAGTIDAGEGDDRITLDSTGNSATSVTLGAGVDTVRVLQPGARIVDFVGGNSGDRLDFSAFGGDLFSGRFEIRQEGSDTWIVESATGTVYLQLLNVQASGLTAHNLGIDVIIGNANAETIVGSEGNEALYGLAGNDSLSGLGGNDTLDGGAGADEMSGGDGDDIYFVDDAGDRVWDSGGIDWVYASVSFELNYSAEYLFAADPVSTDPIDLTGDDSLVVRGNAGNNILRGGSTLIGLGGDDTYYGGNIIEEADGGFDTAFVSRLAPGVHVEVMRIGDFNEITPTTVQTGNELRQTIFGSAGVNFIDGGGGGDTLIGGESGDTYYVNTGDVVIEQVGGGIDTVLARSDFVLNAGAVVERLHVADVNAANLRLTGNEYGQDIAGSSGVNFLDGGGGADVLRGGGGNDYYYVDADDTVAEPSQGGVDNVWARTDYVLSPGAQVEFLSTTSHSGTANLNLTGNEYDQVVIGNNGANILIGGGGRDQLVGFGGNDRLVVDSTDDLVYEDADGGYDQVWASVNYRLAAGVHAEILSTTSNAGTDNIELFGNELGQGVIGNQGNNWLDGGGGRDALVGLGGNDVLITDGDDVVYEDSGGGYDQVLARADYQLSAGAHVEILSTTSHAGTAAINLIGNEFGQAVIGNDGSNRLTGGGGRDALVGLGGNDILVTDGDDVIYEDAGGGYDQVLAGADYLLTAGAHVELLSTTSNVGTANINLTGNALSQGVVGNSGANVLDGREGRDALVGLEGADAFLFSTALSPDNVDQLVDMTPGVDKIWLDNAIFTALADGALPAGAFRTGTSAQESDDRIIYDPNTGTLFYDADGNGAGAAVQFATLSTGLSLAASDFLVI